MMGWHQKPFGLLDIGGFYRQLQEFLDPAQNEGFLRPQHRALVLVEDTAETMLARMRDFRPPQKIQKFL